jgi:uncharacterized protein YjbI with pentapeptide repeats
MLSPFVSASPFDPWVNESFKANVTINMMAFLKGSNANFYGSNFTNCATRGLDFTFGSLNQLQWRYYYGNTEDNVYNTTLYMANASNVMLVCVDAVENLYANVVYKKTLFTSNTAILTAFLQNMIGNLLNVKNIVDKITIA